MNGPNFFIVGAPRSGTSAMRNFLEQHPEIFMSHPKEPRYFCTDFHEESDRYFSRHNRFPIRSKSQYLALFGSARDYRIVGESTTAYLYSRVAAANIFAFNPDARILILLRNPIDFLVSMHGKLVTLGLETETDLGKALELEQDRRNGRLLPRSLFWPSSLYYSEQIRFTEQIGRYMEIFPRKQVKIVVYEDFKNDNTRIYEQVLQFLGVAPDFRPEFRIVNPSRAVRFPALNHFYGIMGDLPILERVPFQLRNPLRKALFRLNQGRAGKIPIDPGLRQTLREQVRPEVLRLEQLLNRDLTALWGY